MQYFIQDRCGKSFSEIFLISKHGYENWLGLTVYAHGFRREVYRILQEEGIDLPRYAVLNRDPDRPEGKDYYLGHNLE